jgi:hypothetical protein
MAQMASRVIAMVNVTVNIILMEKLAIFAKRISTTIHFAKAATVIPQVLSLNLQDAAQYPLENFVSVKSVLKEEFAINVVHFTGI